MPLAPRALGALAVLLPLVTAGAPDAVASPIDAGTILVKYRSAAASRRVEARGRRLGLDGAAGTIPGLRTRVLRVQGDPARVASTVRHQRGVAYAEPNVLLHATATPNDPLLGRLYGLTDLEASRGWDAAGLGAFPATGGTPIGIVDTGVDAGHEDLRGAVVACADTTGAAGAQLREGSCADENGHGTHVAGTAAARANNGVGIAGVAFSSPLVVCRALDADGSGTTASIASCLRWTHDQGARVISMSLGGGGTRTLADAVRYAYVRGARAGSLLVAAAGNDGDGRVEYPAGYPDVVSVGATDRGGTQAPFSNANADVEVSAPGVDILSAKLGGGYVAESGTSMAAPHAAGVAAVIRTRAPGATASSARRVLDAAVVDLGAPGRDPAFGFGRVDLLRAAAEPGRGVAGVSPRRPPAGS